MNSMIIELLWIMLKLMNCDMLLLICGWFHGYELWLLVVVVVNVISWIRYELSWVVVVDCVDFERCELLLLKFLCFKKNQFNCCISHFECCEKSLFDVFEPWDKLLNTLGEWGIKISTFGVIFKETRGQTTQIRTFRSADAWTGAPSAQFQRVSAWTGAYAAS